MGWQIGHRVVATRVVKSLGLKILQKKTLIFNNKKIKSQKKRLKTNNKIKINQNVYESDQPVIRIVLSLVEKTSHRQYKILTPPKLGPPKKVSIIDFRIALTLNVKIVWFGRQVAVCVQKRHKNAICWCSWFQKFKFDC